MNAEPFRGGEADATPNPLIFGNPKHYFTLGGTARWLDDYRYEMEPIKIERIIEHFDPSLPVTQDQTQGLAECALEFIVRKPK